MEEYLSESWIMYCITKFLIILVLVLRFCLHTLYKYSLIDYYELITFLCINLMRPIYVLYSYIIVIIIICTLLSTLILYCACCCLMKKFYIHFGGFLGYWINEYEYIRVRLSVRLRAKQQSRYSGDRNYRHGRFNP